MNFNNEWLLGSNRLSLRLLIKYGAFAHSATRPLSTKWQYLNSRDLTFRERIENDNFLPLSTWCLVIIFQVWILIQGTWPLGRELRMKRRLTTFYLCQRVAQSQRSKPTLAFIVCSILAWPHMWSSVKNNQLHTDFCIIFLIWPPNFLTCV